MFDAFFSKRRAAKEAAELKAIQARDAEVGVPTHGTLKERFNKAACAGKWSIVDDCVQKGCSYNDVVDVSNKRGEAGYFQPYRKVMATSSVMPYFASASERLTLASIAIMRQDVKGLEFLLSRGASPDAPKSGYGWDMGFSPLELAVRYNLPEAAQLLCSQGAEFAHEKALHMAEDWNNTEIIKIIRAEEAKRLIASSPGAGGKGADKLREEFGAAQYTPPALQEDLRVPKPITLKTGMQPGTAK
jgi:hypothetical protein